MGLNMKCSASLLHRFAATVIAVLAFGSDSFGQATSVGINFFSTGGTNSGANLAPGDLAGFVPLGNWNNVEALNASTTNLMNAGGTSFGGLSVSISGMNNGYTVPGVPATANGRLYQGYLDTQLNTTTTVTVSGLSGAGIPGDYYVYVYADGDNDINQRHGEYQIGSTSFRLLDDADTNFSGTFQLVTAPGGTGNPSQAGNYMRFLVNGDSFTLTATALGDELGGSQRAPINGIQIVPIPEPTSILLLSSAAIGGLTIGRRRLLPR